MPRKTNKAAAADTAALPQIPAELLEQLIPVPVTPGQLEDVFQRFKKAFIERALGAEMSQHLGYAAGASQARRGGQPPQWQECQDGVDGHRGAGH